MLPRALPKQIRAKLMSEQALEFGLHKHGLDGTVGS